MARVLSSAALVALGVVGWQLQVRTHETRVKAEAVQQQERRYLPMLRTLLELEVALDRAAREIDAVPPNQKGFVTAAMSAGTQLEAAGYSLFLPDGDQSVNIHVPDATLPAGTGIHRDRGKEYMSVPLRAAVLMYADWLRKQEFLSEASLNDWATCDVSSGVVTIQRSDGDLTWHVNVDSHIAWSRWAPEHRFPTLVLRYARFPYLLQELRFATAKVAHQTLQKHPELGDRYVTIRDDVFPSRGDGGGDVR